MNTIAPGSVIGILGGGQLGRMLAQAASCLGYRAHIFCPEADCPASFVSARTFYADYTDAAALEQFAHSVDVVTFEFENIPAFAVETLSKIVPTYPSAETLKICQHRLREKDFLKHIGIGTAPYAAVASLSDLEQAIQTLGTPCILKTCELGYDGKGQFKIESLSQAEIAFTTLGGDVSGNSTSSYILEGYVSFEMEVSVIVARNAHGQVECYEPVHNVHKNHILHQTIVPAPINAKLQKKAIEIATKIAQELKLVGILAVEMFVTKKGEILVNELAPRPHNSGHWTMDAAITSQFEQTIRAVCGLPLSSTKRLCDAVMTNLIGDDIDHCAEYLKNSNAKLHVYGKKEARAGRKMGHVTELKS